MGKILAINASARYDDSVSRKLTSELIERISNSEDEVIHRDLNEGLHFVSEQSLGAVSTQVSERSSEQNEIAKLSDELIQELQSSETIIIGTPIYNFGPPANLKAWADMVARAGTTFRYSDNGPEGLLVNKKAYIVAVSGGTPIEGEIDFMTPWLKFFLGFIGIKNIQLIFADGIFGQDGDEKIKTASQTIKELNNEN